MEEEDEKELEKFILHQFSWDKLPSSIKKRLENSKEVWKEKVIKYSVKHQLRWKSGLVRTMVPDERAYYLQVLKISRAHYMLYPYHISDVLTRSMRITPFKYYLEMMEDVMKSEQSYDRLPNFTATDCVRLLGIGRNEYIDNMNRCRSKGWLWKIKRNAFRELLPNNPVDIEIDYWWIVNLGFAGEDDIKNFTEGEKNVIDQLTISGPRQAGTFDRNAIKMLYNKGIIYLDVPINSDDYISVPPLENFVMNRVAGDYFENLLYKIFVSMDERTSVEKLAQVLDIDIELAKQAISMYCRLGFAKKKTVELLLPPQKPQEDSEGRMSQTIWHTSWLDYQSQNGITLLYDSEVSEMEPEEYGSLSSFPSLSSSSFEKEPLSFSKSMENSLITAPMAAHTKRIGFIFDYTLTALLMMGNLGSGLKMHAVTMYEVGKLSEESLDDFMTELDKVSDVAEGEAQRYHDHAIALRNTLRFLRKQAAGDSESVAGVDLLRSERLASLEVGTRERILYQNYELLLSMAPISNQTEVITSTSPRHFGSAIPEFNSIWMRLYLYQIAGDGPPCQLFVRGTRVRTLPSMFRSVNFVKLFTWNNEPSTVPVAGVLQILNETLLDSPVLLQCFGDTIDTPEVNIPFPFDLESQEESERGEPVEYDQDNIHLHPLVKRIDERMRLGHQCGFLKLLKVKSNGEKYRWVPEDIHFGIPLHDLPLNQKVFSRIEKFDLFTPESLSKQSLDSRALSLKVLDFIANHSVNPQKPSNHPLRDYFPTQKGERKKISKEFELELDGSVPFPARSLLYTQEQGLLCID